MTNINPVLPQENFDSAAIPSANPPSPTLKHQNPKILEQSKIKKSQTAGGSSNKLWIILLVFLAMIVGFWAGYFTQEYFYQGQAETNDLIGQANQLPALDQTVESVPEIATEAAEINKDYIIFRGEESYLNDGLNFTSQEQCVEDEIVMLTAIEDDYLTIQTNLWNLQEETGEYTAELIDYQVRGGECLLARPVCPNVFIDRCFSLENIDGVYHLDYELIDISEVSQSSELDSEL